MVRKRAPEGAGRAGARGTYAVGDERRLRILDAAVERFAQRGVGALAGVLSPWSRWPILVSVGGMLVDDLIAFTDPMTNWGHPLALAIGVAMWPVMRRWRAQAARAATTAA
jgi:hypothetical protein